MWLTYETGFLPAATNTFAEWKFKNVLFIL